VVYFGDTSADAFKEFEETVHLFNNDKLIFAASTKVMNSFLISNLPSVILLKSFDEKRVDFKGKIDSV